MVRGFRTKPRAAIDSVVAIMAIGVALFAPGAAGASGIETLRIARDLKVEIVSGHMPKSRAQQSYHLTFKNSGPQRTISIDYDTATPRTVIVDANGERSLSMFVNSNLSNGKMVFEDSVSNKSATSMKNIHGYFYYQDHIIARLGAIDSAMTVSDWNDAGTLHPRQSADWRHIAAVDMIVVQAQVLDSETQWHDALGYWVLQGGILVIVSTNGSSDEFMNSIPFSKEVSTSTSAFTGKRKAQAVGLGQVIQVPPSAIKKINQKTIKRWHLEDSLGSWYDYSHHQLDWENAPLQNSRLSQTIEVPYGMLFIVLLIFVILIGPLGWVRMVRNRGQVLRYIFVVMVSSTVFTLGMLLVDIFSTGITPFGSEVSLRFIDQSSEVEMSIQDLEFYAPTRVGTSLIIPHDTVPLFHKEMYPKSIHQHTATEDIYDSLLSGRKVKLLGLRRIGASKGRLLLSESEQGALSVENHLGSAIEHLDLWHKGKRYAAMNIEQGAMAKLEINKDTLENKLPAQSGGITKASLEFASRLLQYTKRSRYHAQLQSPSLPSLEDPYRAKGKQEHVVIGLLP